MKQKLNEIQRERICIVKLHRHKVYACACKYAQAQYWEAGATAQSIARAVLFHGCAVSLWFPSYSFFVVLMDI